MCRCQHLALDCRKFFQWLSSLCEHFCYPTYGSEDAGVASPEVGRVKIISIKVDKEVQQEDSNTLKYRKYLDEKFKLNQFVTAEEWTYESGEPSTSNIEQESLGDNCSSSLEFSIIWEEDEESNWDLGKKVVVKDNSTCTIGNVTETTDQEVLILNFSYIW